MNRARERRLAEIYEVTRNLWDRDSTRPAVRKALARAIQCGTPALGGTVYASETEERIVWNTCKEKVCASCGQKRTEEWQREQITLLPEMPQRVITLTMPEQLWPLFQLNRNLLYCMFSLGGSVMQQYVQTHYGATAAVRVFLHTWGRHMNFHPHLHIMVGAIGLRDADGEPVSLVIEEDAARPLWRWAVITLLREAHTAGSLATHLSYFEFRKRMTTQYERRWHVHVRTYHSTWAAVRYLGRYFRRPPIAQHRIFRVSEDAVEFWTKDLKLQKRVLTRYTPEGFVTALQDHIQDRYQHSVHYFGLLAPRKMHKTRAAFFALLRTKPKPKPRPLSYAESIKKTFGTDLSSTAKGSECTPSGKCPESPSNSVPNSCARPPQRACDLSA